MVVNGERRTSTARFVLLRTAAGIAALLLLFSIPTRIESARYVGMASRCSMTGRGGGGHSLLLKRCVG